MRLDLNYGRGSFPLDLPDDWDVTVIRKPAMPVSSGTEQTGATVREAPFESHAV